MAVKIEQFRETYPQYDELDDITLTILLHKKFYSDLPLEKMGEKFGV